MLLQKLAIFCTTYLERVKGIEPSRPAWKAGALPLSYTRPFRVPAARSRIPERADGGGSWIRTNVGIANGFTARPL